MDAKYLVICNGTVLASANSESEINVKAKMFAEIFPLTNVYVKETVFEKITTVEKVQEQY